ncbi:hypothetical protein CUZ89_1276 [Enterococcus xinjiangensis]|nr:hypothetical protein [Enterococcus lactis]
MLFLGLSIIAAMIGISTSANERANENLSFTVKLIGSFMT